MPDEVIQRARFGICGQPGVLDVTLDEPVLLQRLASAQRELLGACPQIRRIRRGQSFWIASNNCSSHPSRVAALTGACTMIGTSASTAARAALPSAPEEPSTGSSAGDNFTRNRTAASAACSGSRRATARISASASAILSLANRLARHPKPPRRKRSVNAQSPALPITSPDTVIEAVDELLQEVRGLRSRHSIHVVIACRSVDWKNDQRLRRLLGERHVLVEAGPLTEGVVRDVLTAHGAEVGGMRPNRAMQNTA